MNKITVEKSICSAEHFPAFKAEKVEKRSSSTREYTLVISYKCGICGTEHFVREEEAAGDLEEITIIRQIREMPTENSEEAKNNN